MIQKPLTLEFFGLQQKNTKRFLTWCRECKKSYHLEYSQNKRLSQDPDRKRMKQVYTYIELTKEEKEARMREAYAHIYYQAFDKPISLNQLKEIEGIEE